jgi:hypothetical protein
MSRELRGSRYLTEKNGWLKKVILNELPYKDYYATLEWYVDVAGHLTEDDDLALLGCNDRYFLLTALLHRTDALHPWLFDRCREVEDEPDGYIDLWARAHYKSTIITFAGVIQEILCNPNIKVAIFSAVKPIAQEFLSQIKDEFESNDEIKRIYIDVLWENPKAKVNGQRPSKWGVARGITVKRQSNPKEATLEAHGLLDGQPTSRHFDLHVYDDIVTQDYLSDEQIKKTTFRWEMADNLGSHDGVRKWMPGTRYHFADTYFEILERRSLKQRIYPATDDGTENGAPVFLTVEQLEKKKNDQRSAFAAQMLLNPVAGSEATFKSEWFTTYDIYPAVMNVYIMCDPSKGGNDRSDRTAIAVIGIDPAGNKYLLDGYRHRMKLSDRYAFLCQLEEKWRNHHGVQMVAVGYEQYGMVNDLEVIQEYMERDKHFFAITELNTPRQGKHSKDDRIERLEPDLRSGRFKLPCVVHHPEHNRSSTGFALWRVWRPTDAIRVENEFLVTAGYDLKAIERMSAAERTDTLKQAGGCPKRHSVGQVVYGPMHGLTKMQRWCAQPDVKQAFRIVTAVRRRDEDKNIYDLTRAFIEEAVRHPFAAHDDLVDACSRIFDMNPNPPVQFESTATEPLVEDDMGAIHYDS